MKYASIIPLILCCALQCAAETAPHTDPENKGAWVLNKALSDEFSGTKVDSEKWHIQGTDDHYENNFKGRAPSQFVPANVSVSDGHLKITTKWQPDFGFLDAQKDGHRYGNITTGAIISKTNFQHGYMETRCKAANGPVSSSFWTTGKGGELDVFEHWGKDTKSSESTHRYHTSFHDWRDNKSPTWGKRIWTNTHRLDFHVGEAFHVYGFEWDENYIKIFVDGGLVRTVTREEVGDNWVIDDPQKVWLDSEIFPWEVKPASLTAADFPGEGLDFVVDYVRIWQRKGSGDPKEIRQNLIKNSSFESGLTDWDDKSNPKAPTKTSAEDNAGCDGAKAAFLPQGGRALEQKIDLKPNTTYILSGWLSLPGSDGKGSWHHASFGVKNYGGEEVRAKSTAHDFTRYSLQFTTGSSDDSATVFFTNDQKGHPAFGDNFELFEVGG